MTGDNGIAKISQLIVRTLGRPIKILSMTDPAHRSSVQPPDHGISLVGAGGRKLRFVAAALRATLEGTPPNHVLCMHVHLSPVASLMAGRRGRLISLLLGVEAWKPLRALERLAMRRSHLLVAISEHTVRRFREANPDFASRPIQVCHLGVGPVHGTSEDAMRSVESPFALIVGRMAAAERYKGHDLLIDIWPRVQAEVPGARLVIVGDGDDRARLEARTVALREHVSFLGHVSDAALAALYRDCAFFVMPSRDEGFGLVFLEAMRAGKACIGGVGAAAEVIEDGVTGLVVDPAESEQVLKAVLRLFREPETRQRMGRAGAKRLAQHFTEAHFRRRFRGILGLPQEAGWSSPRSSI